MKGSTVFVLVKLYASVNDVDVNVGTKSYRGFTFFSGQN